MTRSEFLSKLYDALAAELDGRAVEQHVRYYEEYILDEIKSGKSERDVLDSLGDPWVIARSIIDAPEYTYRDAKMYETAQFEKQEDRNFGGEPKGFFFDKWWNKVLFIAVLIVIFFVVISVITGLLAFAIRFALPVIAVLLIVNFVKRHR